ncbi:MAG: iron ABC transporter permease [Planctomycetota bacterium]
MRILPHPPSTRRAGFALSPRLAFVLLGLALLAVVALSAGTGVNDEIGLATSLHGFAAALGFADPLPLHQQITVEYRGLKILTAIGVGASLALSGALLQGLYRNDLASPGILGISSGASLGASLALLCLGGWAPLMHENLEGLSPNLVVAVSAFLGATLTALFITTVATSDGRVSVPTLLLVGIAVNAAIGGALAAIRHFALNDIELTRAIQYWGFGSLESASGLQLSLVFGALGLSLLALPFLGMELDLFAGGEEDARALGVDTTRVKLAALVIASLVAALAVATAGQIGFIGLIVPHLLRLTVARSHRVLLPLCLIGGPLFLLGADLGQHLLFGKALFPPSVLMSLFGGPFFLFLLLRHRRSIQSW